MFRKNNSRESIPELVLYILTQWHVSWRSIQMNMSMFSNACTRSKWNFRESGKHACIEIITKSTYYHMCISQKCSQYLNYIIIFLCILRACAFLMHMYRAEHYSILYKKFEQPSIYHKLNNNAISNTIMK